MPGGRTPPPTHRSPRATMDIGNTLRDARRRKDLGLPDCEAATRIRGRYLTALEDERFELLPEPAYARAFLRTYATFLDLDPRPLLEELDERLGGPAGEEARPAPSRPRPVRVPRGRRRGPGRVGLLLAGGVAVVAAAVWLGGNDGGEPALSIAQVPTTPGDGPGSGGTTTARTAPVVTPPASRPTRNTAASLRLAGTAPDGSWVQVRRAGPNGPVVFEGMIGAGDARSFRLATRLWMRVGWGPSLRATVGGRVQPLPDGTSEVTVTSAGISS
ncbi:MAG: helix-turn-helix domain-containing protein [Thermoleophilia bacterium]|nr:helix-turn-helix domain-containing protein [Thermoleophilia bacterium]